MRGGRLGLGHFLVLGCVRAAVLSRILNLRTDRMYERMHERGEELVD